ncbi:CP family cyanate transporter-like MFS transporter [Leucobacter luti]|uniref:CP family cyanate transporter-like MFS transporter n=1 Tax=Leucobacter luti TaxID=340320 RepID=A0A4V3CYB2_9MICO|nr:MFS transporter [Leucobacter luti]TDP93468.1 CP family cyanate transporter-like MFS transporter [Leucobacter luti]
MTKPRSDARPWVLLFVAVCLVAVNMRMTITGVGPLLEQIAADQGVSAAALGWLASVPLIAWAVVSPLAHSLSVRLGLSRTITWSLVALLIGTVWRSLPGGPLHLWLGTALIGAALAIGNVLLPAVIRRDFETRVPLVMGLYTALLGGLGAVSAGYVVPVAALDIGGGALGWRFALLTTGALIPVAIVVWVTATRSRRTVAPSTTGSAHTSAAGSTHTGATGNTHTSAAGNGGAGAAAGSGGVGGRVWLDPIAWWVACYMGLQAALFYIIATWLAPVSTSAGRSPVEAGIDVMLYQIVAIAGSLLLPFVYRGRGKRWVPAVIPVIIAGAFACVVLLPSDPTLWIMLGGLGSGMSLSISLLFMVEKASDYWTAGALSGMAQSVGYLIAAAGPITFGALHEASGGWIVPLALLLAIGAAQVVAGIVLGGTRRVGEART